MVCNIERLNNLIGDLGCFVKSLVEPVPAVPEVTKMQFKEDVEADSPMQLSKLPQLEYGQAISSVRRDDAKQLDKRLCLGFAKIKEEQTGCRKQQIEWISHT